jgi:UDP-N-acetyl-D-mannosaminuronic acid transferase (WecB/TagA/CpsF family)
MSPLPSRRLLGVDFYIGSLAAAVDWVVGEPGDLELVAVKRKAGTKREREGSSPLPPPAATFMPELLGLGYENSSFEQSVSGGLVVAPSAPGLAVDLIKSAAYREALTTASLVLTDSGFMVLLWAAITGEMLPRHSGLKFLRAVLARPELKEPGAVFWVMPSAKEDAHNRAWLVENGFPVTADDVYVAPHYPAGVIVDDELLAIIEARKPRIVMLAIGGGVQERVGLMLRDRLSGRPSILCLGAAIAFLTGGQAHIPPWADKLVLGWLLRLLSHPSKFWRRYWDAIALAPLLWHHQERLPPLKVVK